MNKEQIVSFLNRDPYSICDLLRLAAFSCGELLSRGTEFYASRQFSSSQFAADAVVDYCWEKLHSTYWKDVDPIWSEWYSAGQLLTAAAVAEQGFFDKAVERLDLALLMGAVCMREAIYSCISLLRPLLSTGTAQSSAISSQLPCLSCDLEQAAESLIRLPRVVRLSNASLVEFHAYLSKGHPVILGDAIDHWPARCSRPWRNLDYLKSIAGHRTVPVEIGAKYTDRNWGQRLMKLSDFMEAYLMEPGNRGNSSKGYLAQHDLFRQIPELKRDICIPDYCFAKETVDPDCVSINAWFGPGGTISPAHTDPHDNLLAQVVGHKFVRLFPPSVSECMRPFQDPLLSNTSMIDVEGTTALADYPEFGIAWENGYDCLLNEGDILFIPKGWWHYVRSLSTSFSVSFWF